MTDESAAVERCPRIESNEAEISVASAEAISVRVRAVNLQVELITVRQD